MKLPTKISRLGVDLAALATLSMGLNAYLLLRAPEGPVAVKPSRLIELAREHFPAQYRSDSNAESQKLAFLLSPKQQVRAKALTESADDEALPVALRRAFPTFDQAASQNMGAVCFPREAEVHGRFCVIYAVAAPA